MDKNPDLLNPISILPEDKYINSIYDKVSRTIIPKEINNLTSLGPIGFSLSNLGKRPFDEEIYKRF
ncbi:MULTISPECIES: hypothetical protein [Caloramator]|uniref:Uncharacterized protein n=1 Tax=Caloramator australicus RC3 TaxID=857293 RepID=I7LI42_9CLOT|nr:MULTISPECIES: hypothetical protein [Caloramator]MDO6355899.1 hypothetical protein [Caloramator sp. CAR-1]WDU82119.1 hypothetical protein PWK10_10105 [Caloramator sp. Dgby_cultured_2]CCJ32647.1 hypothetical protein CAAU_0563 [Caloramator australicus RC3]